MIESPTVRDSGEVDPFGERLVALIVDPEALAYVADVLERTEAHDAGAMAIVRAIRKPSSSETERGDR